VPPRALVRSVEERFGLASEPPGSDGSFAEASALMRSDVPAGRQQVASSTMRLANFQVAGRYDAECQLTILAGAGGGVGANVNRWASRCRWSR
jgi:hypothetical protein